MKVVVFIEQRSGKLKPSAFEALTIGAKLAGSAGDLAAVVAGKGIGTIAAQLAGYGADTVFVVDQDGMEHYNVMQYAAAIQEAGKTFGAQCYVGMASPMGRDLFPRLAARLDAGLLTDLTQIELSGSNITGTKPMYAGKCLAKVALKGAAIQMVTLRPNVFPAVKSGQGSATAKSLSVSVGGDVKLKTVEVRKGKSEKPDLAEASFIISGGRAMGSADAFKILHECADEIGATVGASRAAVDSGYAGHDMQVGQTGKTVNPNLYIACGISGSIQHMAGMRTSKVIVAVNTDPEAPIFTIADYGIVGDLFKVVPVMKEKFKKLLGH